MKSRGPWKSITQYLRNSRKMSPCFWALLPIQSLIHPAKVLCSFVYPSRHGLPQKTRQAWFLPCRVRLPSVSESAFLAKDLKTSLALNSRCLLQASGSAGLAWALADGAARTAKG